MNATNATYRAAIFDLDGTLIDSTRAIVESTALALDELGWPPVPEAVIVAHIGYKLEVVFPERSLEERAGLIDTIGKHYTEICEEKTVICDGLNKVLLKINSAEIPLAIVTSKRRGHTEQILNALNVRGLFHTVIGCEDVANMKPDPQGLLDAASALNVSPGHCLYVGDTRVDVETARSAGMAIAGVAWGTDPIETLIALGIDHAVHVPDSLPGLFGCG